MLPVEIMVVVAAWRANGSSIISYILLAALWFKVVMLGLGGVLLNDVKDTPQIGLLIGLVCGISEALVVELLLSRLRSVERTSGQAATD